MFNGDFEDTTTNPDEVVLKSVMLILGSGHFKQFL